MTEQEAKTRWCPFVRHADTGGSFNRGSEQDNAVNAGRSQGACPCRCIGSECMAWRWSSRVREDGYCGLAGVSV